MVFLKKLTKLLLYFLKYLHLEKQAINLTSVLIEMQPCSLCFEHKACSLQCNQFSNSFIL